MKYLFIVLSVFIMLSPAIAQVAKILPESAPIQHRTTSAGVPMLISYQGEFADSNGTGVTGTLPMTFNFWDDSTAGANALTLSFPGVTLSKGLFSVSLDVTGLDLTKPYWLETVVNAQPLAPKARLTSAPYSLAPWTPNGGNVYYNAGNVGIGTMTPASSALLELSSTTKGFLPPRVTLDQRNAIAPAEGMLVYNITSKRPNYYDGTGWKSFDGKVDDSLAIGGRYAGGIIAYIFQPGDLGYLVGETHGIIAAPTDQSTAAAWGCPGTSLAGADGTAIGWGYANTHDIIVACADAGIAAKFCTSLSLGGYTDWYLPSIDELNELYINRAAIGGFANFIYWSSSEFDANNAWFQAFTNGAQVHSGKGSGYNVRAVRNF